MKKVVILAAGLGSRLNPITSHIPKVLVNYNQDTILKHLYNLYSNLDTQEIIVVVNSCYKELIESYCKIHELNITLKFVDEPFGSAYAISKISDCLIGHDVVLNWCDVIPSFEYFSWGQNTIYTYGKSCRFKLSDNKLFSDPFGNVIGVYQYSNFKFPFIPDEISNEVFAGKDFVEFLNTEKFIEQKLKNAVDLGDMPKFISAHENMPICREFNQIEFDYKNMQVIKTPVTYHGAKLQEIEHAWYKKAQHPNVAKLIEISHNPHYSSLKLELIKGQPLFKRKDLIDNPNMINKLKNLVRFSIETKHVNFDQVQEDFTIEIITKTLRRCDEIEDLIKSFGPIDTVNKIKLNKIPLKTLLQRAYNHIVVDFNLDCNFAYSIIHGDPNFSNIVVDDKTNEMKLIDPRGYFGTSKIYGPRIYDDAKILYAYSGYDNFNSNPAWGGLTKISDTEINIEIEGKDLRTFAPEQFNETHRFLSAVIWISLAGYFKNNPLKSISAYYYGLAMLTDLLNIHGRKLQNGEVSFDVEQPITRSITTLNPGKWLLIDQETGEKYRPTYDNSSNFQWTKEV